MRCSNHYFHKDEICHKINLSDDRICVSCRTTYKECLKLIWQCFPVLPKDIKRMIFNSVVSKCYCPAKECKHFTCFTCMNEKSKICKTCIDDAHFCQVCFQETNRGYICDICNSIPICSKCCYACWCQSEFCICKTCFETQFTLSCNKCDRKVDPKIPIGGGFGEHGFCVDGGDYLCCGCDVHDDIPHTDARCTKTKCDGIITLEKSNKKIKK
jgi:hypothetical protein